MFGRVQNTPLCRYYPLSANPTEWSDTLKKFVGNRTSSTYIASIILLSLKCTSPKRSTLHFVYRSAKYQFVFDLTRRCPKGF